MASPDIIGHDCGFRAEVLIEDTHTSLEFFKLQWRSAYVCEAGETLAVCVEQPNTVAWRVKQVRGGDCRCDCKSWACGGMGVVAKALTVCCFQAGVWGRGRGCGCRSVGCVSLVLLAGRAPVPGAPPAVCLLGDARGVCAFPSLLPRPRLVARWKLFPLASPRTRRTRCALPRRAVSRFFASQSTSTRFAFLSFRAWLRF